MSSLFDLQPWIGESGWWLAPEGAAVHLSERLAVVADTHLGYEWTRAAKGDMVPPHSLAELLARLATLLERAEIDRLIVAGDLTESPRPCLRTARDLQRLRAWLSDRRVELLSLPGNHDRPSAGPATLLVAGWEIGHGHQAIPSPRIMIGHHHPAIRESGWSFPCFLVGPSMIVLPALTANASGVDVRKLALPGDSRADGLRCFVPSDGAWLDFGTLEALPARSGRVY